MAADTRAATRDRRETSRHTADHPETAHERYRVTTHRSPKEVHSHHKTKEEARARIQSDGLTNDDHPEIERGLEAWDAGNASTTTWAPDPD